MLAITKPAALMVVAATLILAPSAQAERFRGGVVVVPRVHYYAPWVYRPYLGPYYYPYYAYLGHASAEVKTQVSPKQTEVFVDGYYAGVADDFNGAFKRLRVSPGGHAITLYLDGYRTVTDNVYVRPDSTFTMHDTMQRLEGDEHSALPPVPGEPPASR